MNHCGKLIFFSLFFSLFGGKVYARGGVTQLREGSVLTSLSVHVLYANSNADKVTGATYERKMALPSIGSVGLGIRPWKKLYMGVRYEYWYSDRKFTLNNVGQTDLLKFQTIGGELGYYTGNPRVYYLFSAGVHYPLELKISSDRQGDFTNLAKPLTYQGRLVIGVKFSSLIALQIEGGYRLMDLGNLLNGNTPFLSGGASMNLSGPFLGLGLGLHF